PDMNLNFLKSLHKIWTENDLLGDTANLDFTTIPYWGEDGHLENNWAGKRGKAMASMIAILAHDPDTGIINYGKANVMHKNESGEVMEFLDFYKPGTSNRENKLKYLVFDSKFTNYENLKKLDKEKIKVFLKKKRNLPLILEVMQKFESSKFDWMKKI
ncbi:MAG: hypothetical protein B6D61_05105, partial [Bacteroidetes bacterium 4484_249]